jgi:hypothetical protein
MTRLLNCFVRLLCAAIVLSAHVFAQEPFPITKGTTWTYSARVKWAGTGTQVGGVRTLRWTSSVIDSYSSGEISAALLHGGPWDLAFYSPRTRPHDYAIVRIGNTYYLVKSDARLTFSEIKSGKVGDLAARLADDLWFRTPLEIGENYCAPEQEKTAPFYCWSVEKVTTTHSLQIAGFRPKVATEYFLAFMTNPDTTTLTLVPGAGIVTWDYEHHGTVSQASVKLISFHTGTSAPNGTVRRRAGIQTHKVK